MRPESLAWAVEIASVGAGILYALLAVARRRMCWLFGGLSSAGLAWLAARERLPMQAVLQVFYVVLACYGYWRWSGSRNAEGLVVGWWTWPGHIVAAVAVAVLTVLSGQVLASGIASAQPWLDAATTWASVVATLLAAQARIENWLYWIVIDAGLAVLYARQGLYLVAALFAAYLVIAAAGFVEWRRRLPSATPVV